MLFRSFIVVVISIAASGCLSTVDIEAEDDVSFPNLDLSIPAGNDPVNRVRIRASQAHGGKRRPSPGCRQRISARATAAPS